MYRPFSHYSLNNIVKHYIVSGTRDYQSIKKVVQVMCKYYIPFYIKELEAFWYLQGGPGTNPRDTER